MASIDEKVAIAAGFLLNAPPGEINEVFHDIRRLVDHDASLNGPEVSGAFQAYNDEQLMTVPLEGQEHEVMLSKYARIQSSSSSSSAKVASEEGREEEEEDPARDDRYLDPRSGRTFRFDHLHNKVISIEESSIDPGLHESLRKAVEEVSLDYTKDHYPQGNVSVFAKEDQIILALAGKKYNPANYWNGRWRSIWSFNTRDGMLKGSIKIQVHYYEDGNVQLNSSKEVEVVVAQLSNPESQAKRILKALREAEDAYQLEVNETHRRLNEDTFRSLRRTLPVTRSKVDWDKIANYKIGSELSNR